MPTPSGSASGFNILAVDTSTERLAVSLEAPGGPWHVVAEGGAQASAKLLPRIADLLSQASLRYADLDFIAFGRGPGAFTGLRTACAVAQGIALGVDKPVLAIDSLLIVAEDARLHAFADAPALDIAVAMDARMDEVYAGVYRYVGGAWTVLQAPGLYALPALAAAWSDLRVTALAGSAVAAFGDRLPTLQGAQACAGEHNRAASLLRLAIAAAQAGGGLDAALALPLYLRDKVAQTTAERTAIKAASAA